jgi:hypothetical protein
MVKFGSSGVTLQSVIDGDAPIGGGFHQPRNQPAAKGRGRGAQGSQPQLTNPSNIQPDARELCEKFNRGTCKKVIKGSITCGQNSARRHMCSLCGSGAHGAYACDRKAPAALGNGGDGDNNGKKNNGGKKNRGKRKWGQ